LCEYFKRQENPKAFKKIAQSVDDLVSVDKIISKKQQHEKKVRKIPRSKRKSTRSDLQ
jgi:hypothetical protein